MSESSGFEVDFLPVGGGDRSGDAIAIRYGSVGNYKVLIYDGGTKESGQSLVDHVKKYYGTSRVDYVVNSHPDTDHASGLSVVLDQLEVGELWMHRPWAYSDIILNYFHDGRITDNSLAERLKEKMAAAYALEKIATEKGITIREPYQGAKIGEFFVLSPENDWYVHELVPEFQKSPEQKKEAAAASTGLLAAVAKAAAKATEWIAEHWGTETLRDDVETSAENESSVVLYAYIGGKGVLLTGDAGVRALSRAAAYAELKGVSLPSSLTFVQMPHHGSRNNVSTDVLDRIVGPRKDMDDGQTAKHSYVSVSEKSSTHPRKAVVNAFIRRGAKVAATKGRTLRFHYNMPDRGWGPLTPLAFSAQVDPWD